MQEAKRSTSFTSDSSTIQESANLGEGPSELVGEVLRQIIDRLETRTAEAADLRARLELTERTESTLRENLERERERADRLEAELHTALQARRGWLRRFLGF